MSNPSNEGTSKPTTETSRLTEDGSEEPTQDHDERAIIVDVTKTKLGATAIVLHDLEGQPGDERRGRSGYTRDEVLLILKTRRSVLGPRRPRRPPIGWKT